VISKNNFIVCVEELRKICTHVNAIEMPINFFNGPFDFSRAKNQLMKYYLLCNLDGIFAILIRAYKKSTD